MGGINADERGDSTEDTEKKGPGSTIDTEEGLRGYERSAGDSICTVDGLERML